MIGLYVLFIVSILGIFSGIIFDKISLLFASAFICTMIFPLVFMSLI